ncbi:MAG: YqgE/AlgH family protein [Pirellulales bacterium]|nr:YqgE/AlgH family protein [Pirellulales bacterium]
MDSFQGHLLIASPQLLDPNFVQTVTLLLRHNAEGALGVVLNRPTCKTVKELWQELGQGECPCEQPVYLGGPVSGPLLAVHTDVFLAEGEILPQLYLAASKEKLDDLVHHATPPFKLFVGNAGWGAGQLEKEFEMGGWLTLPATTELVFYQGEDLWDQVAKRAGGSALREMLKLKHVPDDPSLN